VLALGNIGALASKPVMEGKAVLFKKFAGIDSIDIEVNETDPKKFIEIVATLEPSFGGINLEDIKAPDCFDIEETLRGGRQTAEPDFCRRRPNTILGGEAIMRMGWILGHVADPVKG
jgi:malic enzyme